MRITKDLLHKLAREAVRQRKRSEPDLHAAYLMGSLLRDEPLLGGTTDIDLVLVHKYLAPVERETVALTPEISLDIFHKTQENYAQPRHLRQDPWMGYPLTFYPILLFDSDHWLEYVQSSVTADFHRADYVLARVNPLLSSARVGWRSLVDEQPHTHLAWLDQFLKTLGLSANALAGLIGPPLSTRRFMTSFHQRLEQLGTPDVWASFTGLLGCSEGIDFEFQPLITAFEQDLQYLAEVTVPPPHLAPYRKDYYVQGLQALTHSEDPVSMVWPLLRTWLDVHLAHPQPSPGFEVWQDFLRKLNLVEDVSEGKTRALDVFIDQVEILIETWANVYGI
jgi:hypothetical protein